MSDTSTSSDTGITGAAAAFEGLIERSAANEQPTTPAPESNQPQAGPDEVETPAEVPEQGAEVEASEGEPTDEGATQDDPPVIATYTVKLDGKLVEVPLEELAQGYLRTADYTQKTQDLADDRRVVKAQLESVAKERAQYQQLIPALMQSLQQSMPQPPDKSLLQTDPTEYLRQDAAYREHATVLAAAQAEHSRLQQTQFQEQQQSLQARLVEERGKLLDAIPEWRDEGKRKEGMGKLLGYAKKLGFSDEELNQAYDHRAIVAMQKAMKFDELMSARKPQPAPPRSPTASAGSANSQPRRTSEVTQAKQRLAKSGSVADAAGVFANLLS